MGENVRRDRSRSTHFIQSVLQFIFSNEFVLASLFLLALNTSCTNIASNLSAAGTGANTLLTDTSVNSSGGNFSIYSVYPSQAIPGDYDVIGQNAQFDSYCADTQVPNSKCKCEYTFTQPGLGVQVVQGNVDYEESNLIRCQNEVTSGITSFSLRIVTVGGTDASNSLTVPLSGGAFSGTTSYIDLTNPVSYSQVQRYQCRKHEDILDPYDSTMIDPFQSEDPNVVYPFNYYTTNVSDSLVSLQSRQGSGWECTLTATQDRSLQWWANPNVYSSSICTGAFCAGDGQLMYPQSSLSSGKIPVSLTSTSTGKRRSSFAVAKSAYGVFQVPLKAAIAPSQTPANDYVSADYEIIGYAAQPVANASGISSCPNIQLPPNATWVKLWNFRSNNISAPTKVTSSVSISSFAQSGIACNPGGGAVPSCVTLGNFTPQTAVANGSVLASRVVVVGGDATSANTCNNIDPLSFSNGQEGWSPSPFAFNSSITLTMIQSFPWGLYTSAVDECVSPAVAPGATPVPTAVFTAVSTPAPLGCTGRAGGGIPAGSGNPTLAGALPEATPADFSPNITSSPLVAGLSNYIDQLFVITETTVNDQNMKFTTSSSYPQYVPETYRASADCNGVIESSTCPSNKKIEWNINTLEVGSTVGADIYPLCVVQFYD